VGSDLARISFDLSRGYRSVVAQQGRVTLEADINEETAIASEALRLETIDVVGPAGTPDDGYKVSYDATNGLVAAPGTMYVGGWRLTQDQQVLFKKQLEWLDQPSQAAIQGNALAALLVTEQSISATEDQALREVALGGPDTAARTRLMQHFVLIPTTASQCPAAELGLADTLKQMGMQLNPDTLELRYNATLKVSFFPPTQSADPCCPPAQGGYLGADNQLVRVAVSSYSAGSGTLLWGWNNASFLYRATVVSPQVLKLSQAPIDAAHTPQPGQVIEILRTTMLLGNAADKNYAASQNGLVVTLGAGTIYDPASQQLTLPAGTTLPSDPDTLFVRLWQGTMPFTSGATVQLDSVSGLAVTVNIGALPTGPLASRPYWCFAVRPNTPQSVYPQRYLESPQHPEGPRRWLCDLAIVQQVVGAAVAWTVIADCRNHFKPLIDAGDCTCCELALSPADDWVTTLNAALGSGVKALSICFQPGSYDVASTIVFSDIAIKITGAGEGTIINGDSLEVVFEFDKCPDVVLSDITVIAGTAGYSNNPATAGLQGAVTVRACPFVDIERVFLACTDADLRSASCLAVYNPVPPSTDATGASDRLEIATAVRRYNLRVLNSQFKVGHFQVGILVVNADRAQIEGNFILTPQIRRNITYNDLGSNVYLAARLKKQLINGITIVNTAPTVTRRQNRQLLRKQKRTAAGTSVPVNAAKSEPAPEKPAVPAPGQAAGATPAPTPQAKQAESAANKPLLDAMPVLSTLPHLNLGAVGRAHITATFGTLKLQLISSDKLTNAWTDALARSGLNESSAAGQVHAAVHEIADNVLMSPDSVAPAFRNYINGILPALYSTSAQGIVVGGNVANDVRVLNNTIDGTAQGIHVGLSDRKAVPYVSGLQANVVQISGNTINIRLTAEMTGDRHGIFVGGVQSAVISDNHVELFRGPNAGQDIYAIRVVGVLGPRVLIERNAMLRFSLGIYAQTGFSTLPQGDLWKAADNVSTSYNWTSCFKVTDNVP
jgi:Family of unknown function (DUF6519)